MRQSRFTAAPPEAVEAPATTSSPSKQRSPPRNAGREDSGEGKGGEKDASPEVLVDR